MHEITVDDKQYFYKFTKEGCMPMYGCDKYLKPMNDGPSEWHPRVFEPKINYCGYHVCKMSHILKYINAELYIVECRGNYVTGDDKLSFEEMRFIRRISIWNEKMARVFACDCAEHVLHIYEEQYPDDKRPREAIDVIRRWVRGEVDDVAWNVVRDGVRTATWDVVRDAFGDAARSGAWRAAQAAQEVTQTDVPSAAWHVAKDVIVAATSAVISNITENATRTDAATAARDIERDWQVNKFLECVNGVK